ncbi:uncharacterized protein METZ01_LOCUS378983, partial [marine metagenome]
VPEDIKNQKTTNCTRQDPRHPGDWTADSAKD